VVGCSILYSHSRPRPHFKLGSPRERTWIRPLESGLAVFVLADASKRIRLPQIMQTLIYDLENKLHVIGVTRTHAHRIHDHNHQK
jgi:hypothetical protein